MKKLLLLLSIIFLSLTGLQAAEDIVATDTLQFTATRTVQEPNPNTGEYRFSLYGDALDEEWKIQIDYFAKSIYGTFSDDDFKLSDGGKAYNYLRLANNDAKFWSFQHLDVTVSDRDGAIVIDLNGLVDNYGEYRRVLVHAEIASIDPDNTIKIDMGVVAEMPEKGATEELSYILLEASNDDYSILFGISGTSSLSARTYYQVELVRPDFIKFPNDTIVTTYAELVVTKRSRKEYDLKLSLLSEDNTMYEISMHTGEIEVTQTVDVQCYDVQILDYSDTYGLYDIYGDNGDYAVQLAVKPEVINRNMLIIPNEKFLLTYTKVYRYSDGRTFRIAEASARIKTNVSTQKKTIEAKLLSTTGIQFNVTMHLSESIDPDDKDVIEVDSYVGRVDYRLSPGWVGLVLASDEADIHVSLYNGLEFKGTYESKYFDYEGSYVTTYADNDETIRFADVQEAQISFDSIGNKLNIVLDAITVNNAHYRFKATMSSKRALTGSSVNYSVDASTDAMMVAFVQQGKEENSYRLQFQRCDQWADDGSMLGNSEIWDFAFSQNQVQGIAGEYGYAAETLSPDYYHIIYEDGTEIYLSQANTAGTLKISVVDELTVELSDDTMYKTHLYNVEAKLLGANNIFYNVTGQNFLLCADYETGEMLELSEAEWTAIKRILSERGYDTRKLMRHDKVIIERGEKAYSLSGSAE